MKLSPWCKLKKGCKIFKFFKFLLKSNKQQKIFDVHPWITLSMKSFDLLKCLLRTESNPFWPMQNKLIFLKNLKYDFPSRIIFVSFFLQTFFCCFFSLLKNHSSRWSSQKIRKFLFYNKRDGKRANLGLLHSVEEWRDGSKCLECIRFLVVQVCGWTKQRDKKDSTHFPRSIIVFCRFPYTLICFININGSQSSRI